MTISIILRNLYKSEQLFFKPYINLKINSFYNKRLISTFHNNTCRYTLACRTIGQNYHKFSHINRNIHEITSYNLVSNADVCGISGKFGGVGLRCFTTEVVTKSSEVQNVKKKSSLWKKVLKVPVFLVKWVVYIPYRIGRRIFRLFSLCFRGFNKLAKLAARAAVLQKVTGVSGIFKSIVGGIKHTIHWCKTGTKLYAANVKVSYYILKKLIKGHPMRYHERKLLTKTMNDALKLVPFSFFIIVPFAEFLLPVVIRFFPQMLPSTFQTNNKDDDYLQKKLMAKKELATFFQELVQERTNTILQAELDSSLRTKAEALKQFQERLLKKSDDMNPFLSANELLVFSKLFKKEFVLDKMNYKTLKVMCQLLGITPFALKSHLVLQLRYCRIYDTFRHHLLKIQREDRLIMWEGVDSLSLEELQEACKERAMKFYNVTKEQLQQQLKQWLDLSSRPEINPILLLWSRCITMTHEPMVIKDSGASAEDPESAELLEGQEPEEEKVGMKMKVIQDVVDAAQVDEEHLQDKEEMLEQLSEKVKELKEIIEKEGDEEVIKADGEGEMEPELQEPHLSSGEEDEICKIGLLSKDELVERHKELLSALDVQMQISDLQYHQLTELYSYMVKMSEKAEANEPIRVNQGDLRLLLESTSHDFKQIEHLSAQFQKISQNLTL